MPAINYRYQLGDAIGAGLLGKVYRALDRVTGETITLKHITVSPSKLAHGATNQFASPKLGLAYELSVLAPVRHPYLYSINDFGFDDEGRPFIINSYFDEAERVLAYARGKPDNTKLRLLHEMLEGMVHLHGRGVLHQNIKPANVFVLNDHVRLTDFGIWLDRQKSDDFLNTTLDGSIQYIAPEVLRGEAPTEASDLYSVGILAYELFTGNSPFKANNLPQLVMEIIQGRVDVWAMGLDYALAAILDQLLDKDPAQRFVSAAVALHEIARFAGTTPTVTTSPIRAWRSRPVPFMGRHAELTRLTSALNESINGQGSAWLIGGGSGVGKSRLLDELLTRALVRGALVVRGEAVEGMRLPYQALRDVVRVLALTKPLTNLQAGVLKPLVPDIETLLDRPVADAPALDPPGQRQRLVATLRNLIREQDQPIVLLFNNLHWATEALEPLRQMVHELWQLPLLIVGTYRTDLAPDLPERLRGMQLIPLHPLEAETIEEMATAMLGSSGDTDEFLRVLRRETEGNTFYLVQTLRALDRPDPDPLGDGVLALLRRQLAKIPADAMHLLQVAATLGLVLDTQVMDDAIRVDDVDALLLHCEGVLEYRNGQWRFVHERMRQLVLESAPNPAELHSRIAQAIETVYPGDPQYALILAMHWYAAGDRDREATYALQAATDFNAREGWNETISLVERTLDRRKTEDETTVRLLLVAAEAHRESGQRKTALTLAERAQALAQTRRQEPLFALALAEIGQVYSLQGDYTRAETYFGDALALHRAHDDALAIAAVLVNLGWLAYNQGNYDDATACYDEALVILRANGRQRDTAMALTDMGWVAYMRGDFDQFVQHYEEGMRIFTEIDDQKGIAFSLNNLGIFAFGQRDYDTAREHWQRALQIFRAVRDHNGLIFCLNNLGEVEELLGRYDNALSYLRECLSVTERRNDRRHRSLAAKSIAFVHLSRGDTDEARVYLRQALSAAYAMNTTPLLLEVLVGYARCYCGEGEPERAAPILDLVEAHPALNTDVERKIAEVRAMLPTDVPPNPPVDDLSNFVKALLG